MTTTSISGSEFGKAGNYIYWEDVTDEELDAMQKDYWELLTKKFEELCRERGSSAWLELDLSAVYHDVDDRIFIDFSEVLAEAREYAFDEAVSKSESGDCK